ncbi:unnamed protein product [Phytophthora lilii]|uniref:Unnamed protein product n=1 Tax=Phytophthora lilii TaxID=2077276 RepID=A0A9W7CNJ3_9STRA|nr:unnamed protein product [Phytophthora lilii]
MLAATNGHVEIIQLLWENGAEVDEMTWNGHTALTFAAEEGQEEAVRALGADVSKHGIGSAPLAAAAQRGHADVIKLLLKNNVKINAQDADGCMKQCTVSL